MKVLACVMSSTELGAHFWNISPTALSLPPNPDPTQQLLSEQQGAEWKESTGTSGAKCRGLKGHYRIIMATQSQGRQEDKCLKVSHY